MMHQAPEDACSSADWPEDHSMFAEGPGRHLAARLDGDSFEDHERQCAEQHHERALEWGPLLRLHRSGGSSNRLSCWGPLQRSFAALTGESRGATRG